MASGACPACGNELDGVVLRGPDRLYGTNGTFEVAACSRCGSGATLPRLGRENVASFYPQEYVAFGVSPPGRILRAMSRAVRSWQSRRDFGSRPLDELVRMGPGRALDVGCGRGDLGAALIAKGWQVTGIEPSAAACAQAQAQGLDARCGTLETVEVEAAVYDAVIFRHSLEHVPDPVDALTRARRAIRPGGLAVISLPNFESWQRRRFGSSWFHLDLPRHRVHFSRAGLTSALTDAGLEPIRFSTSTSAMGLPATLQYAIVGRCLFPQGLPFRVAVLSCTVTLPVTWLIDRFAGESDVLHVVARRLS